MRYWLMAAVAAVLFAGSFAARSLLAPSSGTAAGVGSAAPGRIVSLSPGITESLYAVGAGGQVVGVTTYCNWPPEARALPRVGAFLDTNFEAIVGLAPDLVVLMPSHRDHRTELERLGRWLTRKEAALTPAGASARIEVKEGRKAARLPPSLWLNLNQSLSKDGGNLRERC